MRLTRGSDGLLRSTTRSLDGHYIPIAHWLAGGAKDSREVVAGTHYDVIPSCWSARCGRHHALDIVTRYRMPQQFFPSHTEDAAAGRWPVLRSRAARLREISRFSARAPKEMSSPG